MRMRITHWGNCVDYIGNTSNLNIFELRTSRGLTVQDVSELIGFHKSTITKYENGSRMPSVATQKLIKQKIELLTNEQIEDHKAQKKRERFIKFGANKRNKTYKTHKTYKTVQIQGENIVDKFADKFIRGLILN